jgi:hypothetical protein
VAGILHRYGESCAQQGRAAEAESMLDRAIAIGDRAATSPGDRSARYMLRATLAWTAKRRSEAVSDLRQAMLLAEQQRGQASGDEVERAQTFSTLSSPFEQMVAWQLEMGDMAEALGGGRGTGPRP